MAVICLSLFSAAPVFANDFCEDALGGHQTPMSFSTFKALIKSRMKVVDSYSKYHAILDETLEDAVVSGVDPEVYTRIALKSIRGIPNLLDYIGYENKRSDTLETFKLIRAHSSHVDLDQSQVDLIAEAMEEANSSGWMLDLPRTEVLAISRNVFGSRQLRMTITVPNDLAPENRVRSFKKDLKKNARSNSDWTNSFTSARAYNKVIKDTLAQYRGSLSNDQFVEISVYLINWKTLYRESPFKAIIAQEVTNAFEIIRRESLNYPLNDKQIARIRQAMEDRPSNLSEFLVQRLDYRLGWRGKGYQLLQRVLIRPFGKKTE